MLADHVRVSRRFQRSIRIDRDLEDARALEGFVCPQSSANALLSMARHIGETRQAAFTWTGPYGSGKSSLALALAALLSSDEELRTRAAGLVGAEAAAAIWGALPLGCKGWRVVPVVGRRASPSQVIGDALVDAGLIAAEELDESWDDNNLVRSLSELAMDGSDGHGGVLLFVDELGKLLESAARDGDDIYVFQQLAEIAARSVGRLVVVGVLHQAFDEYANRLSRETRDEWAKVQGRFVDLSLTTGRDEQLDLLSRAIESDRENTVPGDAALEIAAILRRDRPGVIAETLEACWPLHPVVACLVGPMSRTRFGQNQRSVFGFLSSAEAFGFREFLAGANDADSYTPDRLWDYLRSNLEPSILASPDGHRWALAVEALDRCESIGGEGLHVRLLKTIGVIDFFRERSGLPANLTVLQSCNPDVTVDELEQSLTDLANWSVIVYRKYLDAYSIFAGSDFDLEAAVSEVLAEEVEIDFDEVTLLAGIQPVLAKRHYHSTGALRWFDISVLPASEAKSKGHGRRFREGAIGQFALVVPLNGETADDVSTICRQVARRGSGFDVVAGMSEHSLAVVELAREMLAVEHISAHRSELAGDTVARREVRARLAELQGRVEDGLRRMFDTALWFRKHYEPKRLRLADLNYLASELADRRFSESPLLHNELLNRHQPSSSAIAAQNVLLRAMVLRKGQPRLGIDGFPAEGGLFASLLEATGLYGEVDGSWRFVPPRPGSADPAHLAPVWEAATAYLADRSERTVGLNEIFDVWRREPFGVKDGLLPTLAVAYVLSNTDTVSVYREGTYRPELEDVDVDLLAKNPDLIQLRWTELSGTARDLLMRLAEIIRELDVEASPQLLEPLHVARSLVGIFDRLAPWVKRTAQLSPNAARVRDLLRRARDPNRLLFIDIPRTFSSDEGTEGPSMNLVEVANSIHEGLRELSQAYEMMLARLSGLLLTELGVPNDSPSSLRELRQRAANAKGISGDFRMEAFISRLEEYEGTAGDIEGIASLLNSKPPEGWVDPDIDRASITIAEYSERFMRLEVFTHVRDRPPKRRSLAVFVGEEGAAGPVLAEFTVTEADALSVEQLAQKVSEIISRQEGGNRDVVLAALANVAAALIREDPSSLKTDVVTGVSLLK